MAPAHVVMRGEADLKNETQHLNVNVQPELGGSAALGVAVINPLAGMCDAAGAQDAAESSQQGVQFRVSGHRQMGRPQGREDLPFGDPGASTPDLPFPANPDRSKP
jgi:hypothetical protein